MSEQRDGWRRGVRPGLIGALVVGVLILISLGRYPEISVGEASLTFFVGVLGTFGFILLLYGSRAVRPASSSREFNPFVLGLALVGIALLLITEC